MSATGQTINDRLNAVRYALVGQGLARTVCKATTEEVLGPKKKHIDYLLACTNEPNVSIPQMANLLIERTQHTSWAVVFKALISIHHLMSYGNERFTQYLATSNHSFELADFMDRTTPQGYSMSTFVRRYAKYINEKSISYRALAIDLCKLRSGASKENPLRTMNMDNLNKSLPTVQNQFDVLLDFGATAKDLNNGVIMAAFRLLYKDLVKTYAAYQEAIINLLERFFKLSRKKAREGLEWYRSYLTRMTKVEEFLKLVEEVGLDKSEMPNLMHSSKILTLLEQHVARQDASKGKRGATPASPENQADDEEYEADEATKEEESAAAQAVAAAVKADGGEPAQEAACSSSVTDGQSDTQRQQQKEKAPETVEPERGAPPQKPARPSPKGSPKVSPSKPKSPTVLKSTPTPSSGPEKKAPPPERPAKPPSRPPPPSSAAASSSQAPSGGAAPAPKHASPTPPPHPPPPHPHPPAHIPPASAAPQPATSQPQAAASTTGNASSASSREANNGSITSTTTTDTSTNDETAAHQEAQRDAQDNDRASEDGPVAAMSSQAPPTPTPPPPPPLPPSSCSAAAASASNQESGEAAPAAEERSNHTSEPSGSEAQEVEANHVNNVNHAELIGEREIPTPPPPIDEYEIDDDIPPPPAPPAFVRDANPGEGEEGAAEAEPVVNGQSHTNAAE